jgi:DNA invertase Pin-like site-specific DNA recombinase
MIGAINEFERANLLERQREGIALAKQQGKYKGRKKIGFPDNWSEVYDQWKHRQITGTHAMTLLNLKRNTFYNLLKEYEEKSA